MKKTQAQWFDHIKKFVPSWQFERDQYNVALFQAIAAEFAAFEEDAEDQYLQTYIMNATTPILNLLGDERGKFQLPSEGTEAFRKRVQRLASETDKTNIKKTVDALLLRGECTIREAGTDSPYCSRGSFVSRESRFLSLINDYFLVVVPSQSHLPYSFLSRDTYASRLNFIGSTVEIAGIYTNMVKAINEQKAFGVLYGIVESA